MTNLTQIISNGMAQGLTARAIAHRIQLSINQGDLSIMSETHKHLCKDCGLPMETIQQVQHNAPSLTVVTCKNKTCALYGVTLSVNQYNRLTEEQLEGYRKVVAGLKARYQDS